MSGFIFFCKDRETTKKPYCMYDDDPVTLWNHPIYDGKPIQNENRPRHNRPFGWGRNITSYAFDELFLKHVIYYYAYPNISFQ